MYNIYIYMYKNRFICKSFSKSTFERYPRRLLLKCAAGMTKSAAFSPPARCVSIGKRTTRPEISEWPWIAAMFSLQNSQIASDKDAFFLIENGTLYILYVYINFIYFANQHMVIVSVAVLPRNLLVFRDHSVNPSNSIAKRCQWCWMI